MRDKGDGLVRKSNLEYCVVSLQFNSLWFVERHNYWMCDCDFEMHMRESRRLIKNLIEWHNVEVVAPLHRDRPALYVPVRVGWEPSRLFLVPLPSFFAYYSGQVLCGSEADKAHT